ncbi:hypothetical protein PNOK_0203000 [Pyrrhoderma noxium]|uniref:MARVEL domain-containing protein n=1 Tax=Pyrrhoderma noxium TaxID=2282107 RepID=A0A286UR47_9AGAM|nr:hypothetical protein PNOK_0203000 [Pyrrhoderma noxium]
MVDFDAHIKRGHPVIFGLIVFFAIIEGAIATWLISRYDKHHNYPSTSVRDRTGFLTFTSWWTVLFGLIYLGAFLHSTSGSIVTSVGSHGIFLILTWIFWTAGAASITEALGGGNNCSNLSYNLPYCNQLNALEGFAWVTWIFVTIALVVVLLRGCTASRRGDGLRGPLVV